ncbi:MAG: hypothetical protein ACU0FH_10915 [Heliomarina sp.]|uniref:hypothetical protein n=1 Tax=Heliomarina sp. TaxID=2917556 RepID=UPI0040595D31
MFTNTSNTMVFAVADQIHDECQNRRHVSGKLNTTTKQTNANKRQATIAAADDGPLGGVTCVTLAWIVVVRSLATFPKRRQAPNGRPILEKLDQKNVRRTDWSLVMGFANSVGNLWCFSWDDRAT